MTTVALLSCTKSKKTYRCKAKEMYSKSPRFRLAYTYASLIADEIYILSAKHGLLTADQEIDPYDETLNDKTSQERLNWKDKVLDTLGSVSVVDRDDYILIAGQNYYEHLLPRIKRFWLPLRGKRLFEWAPELERLLKLERTSDPVEALHLLFNGLPRLDWTTINIIPYSDGIYIMFEEGEIYQGMNRIVRVGTHRSQGRLKRRLMDHFVSENADGSIFRKNIGRAFLNKYQDPYLEAWEINLSKTGNRKRYAHTIDEQREDELESRVTRYLRENISYTCLQVDEGKERLRLEEGIIATLNRGPSFKPSNTWLGSSNPVADLAGSGLWNREGLDGRPLTDYELKRIIWLSRFGNDYYQFRNHQSSPKKVSVEKPVNPESMVPKTADDIRLYLDEVLQEAKNSGAEYIDLVSGSIHKRVGLKNRMPQVCGIMYKMMLPGDEVLHSTPSGHANDKNQVLSSQ